MPSTILGVAAITGKQKQMGPVFFLFVLYSIGGDRLNSKNKSHQLLYTV